MKLNPDCIRDILLTVEEQTGYRKSMLYCSNDYFEQFTRLKPYDDAVVRYHINQCDLNGFFVNIYTHLGAPPQEVEIFDLSPHGHEFLANIRKDAIWDKVKNIANKVGSTSLNAFVQIAAGVVKEVIKAQFGV